MVGRTISHFTVLEKLGEGGMGVVYKARDTHLDRFVAIKVLPAEKVANPERKRRFVQEAKAASALNHPNIITIYDIDQSDGTDFIAMEYVPGKTLDQWIGRKGLGLGEALKYAVQIADALVKAHSAGIVHRDLKPANIMVTQDGLIKLLDFGLAKLTEPLESDDLAPTETLKPHTEEGTIVGTVAYMSPEQAEGKKVDARSDIFSFGSVLYEMVTGRRAFQGETKISTLSAILHQELKPLGEGVPLDLEKLLLRCLRKDPERRAQLMKDVKIALEELKEESESGKLAGVPVASKSRPWPAWTVAATAVVLLAVAASVWYLRHSTATWDDPLANAQFSRLTNFEGAEAEAVISADGKFVAFLSGRDGPVDVWISQVGSGQFTNLTKGRFPELAPARDWEVRPLGFSPDGTHVSLQWRGGMWLLPVLGGSPRPLVEPSVEAMWSADGSKLVYHTFAPGDPIFVADPNGLNPKQIFVDRSGAHCHYPTWSPDGRFIYFTRGYPTANEMDIWRVASTGGDPERITHHSARVAHPALLDNRTLVYSATAEDGPGAVLYAMDLERRLPRVITSGVQQYSSVSASSDGKRLVVTESNPSGSLWTIPLSDSVQGEAAARRFELPTARAVAPRFGPNYLLYLSSTGGADGLWKFKDGSAAELWKPSGGGLIGAPAISADGRKISFAIRKQGRTALYRMCESGASPTRLAPSLYVRGSPSWSPDGNWIVISGDDGKGSGLFKAPADGGPPVRLREGLCFHPIWSPDGRLILYSEPLGGADLRVKAVAPDGAPVALPDLRVGYTRGSYCFLPGGKALVVSRGGPLWLVDLATGSQRQLTKLPPGVVSMSFDISPDGKQILFDRLRDNSDIVLIDLVRR